MTLRLFTCLFLLCSASTAHAFAILFYDVRPAEKLLDLPSLSGSRTIAPKEFAKLTPMELLAYDLIYIDASASDLHHLSAQSAALREAVEAGVGLYLQGDVAAYAAFPVDAPGTRGMRIRAFDFPYDAYDHPLAADGDLLPNDFGDAASAQARGFTSVPEGFSIIAYAEGARGERLPILLAGKLAKGRVVMRSHEFIDRNPEGVEKIDAAIIAWLTSQSDEPRIEPLPWIVANHPRKDLISVALEPTENVAVTVRKIVPLGYHAARKPAAPRTAPLWLERARASDAVDSYRD